MDMNLSKLRDRAGQRRIECYSPWGLRVGHSLATVRQLSLSTIMLMNVVSLFTSYLAYFHLNLKNSAYKGLPQ